MKARELLLEAPPNVDALHQKLAVRLEPLYRRYLRRIEDYLEPFKIVPDDHPALVALTKAVKVDPVLKRYLLIRAQPSVDARYNPMTHKIELCPNHNPTFGRLMQSLKHELVHREQHRRSGFTPSYGYRKPYLTARAKLDQARAALEQAKLKQAAPSYVHPFRAYDQARAKSYTLYLSEPIEAQAHAVVAADKLKLQPDWKERLRKGKLDWSDDTYLNQRCSMPKKAQDRFLKNVYQAITAEALVNSLLI